MKESGGDALTVQRGFSVTSTATVPTVRPARYAKQLASHMSRKISTTWDPETERGSLLFNRDGHETGYVELSCTPDTLIMTLQSTPEHLERLEHVAGIHLARFGRKDGMVVAWIREDGTPGAIDGPLTEDDAPSASPS